MRELGERQAVDGIQLFCGHRRIRRVDAHETLSGLLDQHHRVQRIGLPLDDVEVLCEGYLVALAVLEGMQVEIVGVRRRLCQIAYLGYLPYLLRCGAGGKGIRQGHHRPLSHPVHQIVGTGIHEDRRFQAVLPVIIMGEPAQRSLDAADDHRHVGIELLQNLGVDRHCIVRTVTGTAFGRICIIAAQTLGSRIVVDHRVHIAGVDGKEKPRHTHLPEVAQVIPPVGLGNDRHLVAAGLERPCHHRRTERRMVDERIPGEQNHIGCFPA